LNHITDANYNNIFQQTQVHTREFAQRERERERERERDMREKGTKKVKERGGNARGLGHSQNKHPSEAEPRVVYLGMPCSLGNNLDVKHWQEIEIS